MVHITEEQVKVSVSINDAVTLVEEAFRRLGKGRMVNHPRRRIRLEGGAFLHSMEAGCHVSRRFATKQYVTHPQAGAKFLVTLFDADKASILATIEADALGQIRTGAASAVGTKYMAREDATVMGMLGSGWQAESQLAAIATVRPLSEVRVFSPTQAHRESFAQKMSEFLGLNVIAVDTAEAAVHGADIVTAILSDEELRTKWEGELAAMRDRIRAMRNLFVEKLAEKGVPGDYSFIKRQNGMFSFSGLKPDQVNALRDKYSIYIVGSGRINVAGMTESNMDTLCEAIAEVI
jgi:ornithine cyclodeaminase/alanine dehydrogenase-like protein (mu-crystallin family)